MAFFENKTSVHNQAGHQVIHGDVNYYSVPAAEIGKPRYGGTSADAELDGYILASLSFPEMLQRRASVELPFQGTCQWILQLPEYISWKARSSGLLWIKGKPGAGKSTLMSHLYHVTRTDSRCDVHLHFFFTARGVHLQRTPVGMFRSLLSQLFQQDPGTRGIIREAYKEKIDLFGKVKLGVQDWEWQLPELELLLTNAVLASAQEKQITLFIDALDEAGELAARQVARGFHSINDRIAESSISTAKICISCRHYPILSSVQGTEIHVENHNRDDIAAYIRGHIPSDCSPPKNEWGQLASDIIQQSGGIFQWVRLIAPMIEKHIADGDSPDDVREWLRRVPEELGDMYSYILQNVVDSRHIQKSFQLFKWVCLTQRSLTVTEIRYAMAAHGVSRTPRVRCHETRGFVKDDYTMALRVKSWSGGLIEVVALPQFLNQPVLQVIHQSVNDFFLSPEFQSLSTQSFGGEDRRFAGSALPRIPEAVKSHHGDLYWLCLKFLSSESATMLDGTTDTPKLTHPKTQFHVYATPNFLIHAEKAGSYRSHNLQEEALLLSDIVSNWTYMWHDRVHLERGTTMLHIAAAANMEDLVAYLLGCGTDVNVTDKHWQTALHIAVHSDRLAIAKRLVDAGADTRKMSRRGGSPLEIAGRNGYSELFSWLAQRNGGLDLSMTQIVDLLRTSALRGDLTMVKIILDSGACTASQGILGVAVEAALERGHTDVATLLIKFDAPSRVQADADGVDYYHALLAASLHCDCRLVGVLIEAGIDPDLPAGQDPTGSGNHYHAAYPLNLVLSRHNVGRSGEATEIVRMLIEAGADVDSRGLWGSALQAASSFGFTRAARLLVDAGADVNAPAGRYGTALGAARDSGNEDIVRLLERRGAR